MSVHGASQLGEQAEVSEELEAPAERTPEREGRRDLAAADEGEEVGQRQDEREADIVGDSLPAGDDAG